MHFTPFISVHSLSPPPLPDPFTPSCLFPFCPSLSLSLFLHFFYLRSVPSSFLPSFLILTHSSTFISSHLKRNRGDGRDYPSPAAHAISAIHLPPPDYFLLRLFFCRHSLSPFRLLSCALLLLTVLIIHLFKCWASTPLHRASRQPPQPPACFSV